DDARAVAADGHAVDGEAVVPERVFDLASLQVPDLDGPVKGPRDGPGAIGADRHAQNSAQVSLQGASFLARLAVPGPDGAVVASRDDPFAVVAAAAADGHAADPARVSAQRKGLAATELAEMTGLPGSLFARRELGQQRLGGQEIVLFPGTQGHG